MDPEDGRLCVYGVGEDGVTAFTDFGIENLKQLVADLRAEGRAPPPKPKTANPRSSPDGYRPPTSRISAGAQTILDAIRARWPWLKHLFADGAYDRRQLLDKAAFQ